MDDGCESVSTRLLVGRVFSSLPRGSEMPGASRGAGRPRTQGALGLIFEERGEREANNLFPFSLRSVAPPIFFLLRAPERRRMGEKPERVTAGEKKDSEFEMDFLPTTCV